MSIQAELAQFKLSGLYSNNIDSSGNLHFARIPSELNENGPFFPIATYIFDNDEITALYNPEISELSLNTTKLNSNTSINVAQGENVSMAAELQLLKNKLDDNVANNVNTVAAKDTIIQLRMQLGEGTSPENFNDEFPYLPK